MVDRLISIRSLFSRRPPERKPFPPAPPGWNKTFADLMAEKERGERDSVGGPETKWADDYERSLLPADTRFPQRGDVHEALEDMTVKYLTAWKATYTGGGKGLLRAGERVIVANDPLHAKPLGVCAKPVDHDALERRMVPEADRSHPKYGGFHLFSKTVDLNRKFKLVKPGS